MLSFLELTLLCSLKNFEIHYSEQSNCVISRTHNYMFQHAILQFLYDQVFVSAVG